MGACWDNMFKFPLLWSAKSNSPKKRFHGDDDMEEAPDCEEHVGLFWIAASFNPWAALRVELMFYSTCNQGERV